MKVVINFTVIAVLLISNLALFVGSGCALIDRSEVRSGNPVFDGWYDNSFWH